MQRIIMQSIAGAFLKRGACYLLMKRGPGRAIAPDVWSCVGGHMEPREINDPYSACLREIYEETGITQEHIHNLELRYIIVRRSKNVIRQSYIYFGETDVSNVTGLDAFGSDEGTLHWIDENDLLHRQFTATFEAMLKHYVYTPDNLGRVVVGIAANENNKCHMNWSVIEDFE